MTQELEYRRAYDVELLGKKGNTPIGRGVYIGTKRPSRNSFPRHIVIINDGGELKAVELTEEMEFTRKNYEIKNGKIMIKGKRVEKEELTYQEKDYLKSLGLERML